MKIDKTALRTLVNSDGAAILDSSSGEITTLNTTGAYVWEALQRGDDADVIAANLARDTGEDLFVVEQGVATFLRELEEHRFCSR